ncbi:TPA: hypothetical protein LU109_003625 [Enterobacter hormaechei subsp. xiangfangensis]|nr:hypothetical protein [Enterobacter hormaechei subsp. xiangfangensis]
MIKKLLIAAALIGAAGAAQAHTGKYEYLYNDCTRMAEELARMGADKPFIANMEGSCALGIEAGLKGFEADRRQFIEWREQEIPNAQTGMGDAAAIFKVAQYDIFLKQYDRAFAVTHGKP